MRVFCLEDFKIEFEKLRRKKSYDSTEQDIIDYFFGKSVQELSSGVKIK